MSHKPPIMIGRILWSSGTGGFLTFSDVTTCDGGFKEMVNLYNEYFSSWGGGGGGMKNLGSRPTSKSNYKKCFWLR